MSINILECRICNKEFNSIRSISAHIIGHKIKVKEYYDKYIRKENEGYCKICNKEVEFEGLKRGYDHTYCSFDCSNKDIVKIEKIKNTNNQKYGGTGFQVKELKDKYKEKMLEKYGVEHNSQLKETVEKRKETWTEKYEVDNPQKCKEIKEKTKLTNIERYGVEVPLQNKEIKEKMRNTCLEKYGEDCIFKVNDLKESNKELFMERYGVDSPLKSKEIQEKIKQTNLVKYGKEYVLGTKEIIEKSRKKCLEKYGVDSYAKTEEYKEKLRKRNIEKIIPKVNKILELMNIEILPTSIYINIKSELDLKCKKCGNIFNSTYFSLYYGCGRCPNCYRTKSTISLDQVEVTNFIKELGLEVIEDNRKIIDSHKELDIFIPSLNIAIEYNGLYWHSENYKDDLNYHLNKTVECENKNIRLIHIFSDEWMFKKDIVKARLRQILNKNNNPKIYARKCIIKEIDTTIKNNFLNSFHLQGSDNSTIKLGAFYNNELVSVMTFSHGNISKGLKNIEDIWELNRFCSNYNYNIIGIASKLLEYFKRNYKWQEIYSYADRRWSNGNLYYKLGFELDHISKPNYWYTKNNLVRIHRFNLRKQHYEPKDVPEKILRLNEGYVRIWDCGNYKFILRNS